MGLDLGLEAQIEFGGRGLYWSKSLDLGLEAQIKFGRRGLYWSKL
jgi:hypothetical protein